MTQADLSTYNGVSADESRTLKRLHTLYRATALAHRPFDEQFQALLRAGVELLGMEMGFISRIDGQTYTLLYVHSPTNDIQPGQQFDLGQTLCDATLAKGDLLYLPTIDPVEYSRLPAVRALKLRAYIGVPIIVDGKPFGTLNFSSTKPHQVPFDDGDIDFFRLVASWISATLERQEKDGALRASEARLRSLLRNSPDAVYIKDRQSRFTFANQAQARNLGVQHPDELIGKTDEDFVASHLGTALLEEERQLIETGVAILDHEEYNPTPEGYPRWFSSTKAPFYDDQGAITGLVGISRDITARKLIELENTRLFETSLDLLGSINQSHYVRLNPAWERMLGYSRDELYQIPYLELINPDDIELTLENISILVEGKPVSGFQNRLRGKDGIYRWFSWDIVPDLETGLVHLTGRNITADKLLEEQLDVQYKALLESESRFRQMAETLEDCFWMYDPIQDEMIYISPSYERITGYSVDTRYVDPHAHLKVLAPEDQERLRDVFAEPDVAFDERYRLIRPDGSRVWVWETAYVVTLDDGSPYRMIGILRDITAEKLAELRIQEQNEILQVTNRALETARVQAEAASRLKSNFLATMSHELRTPLNAIIGYTQLQQAGMVGALSPEQSEFLERTLVNANDLLRLINEVLDLSKIEAGRMELMSRPFSPSILLQEIMSQHQVLAESRNLMFTLKGSHVLPPLLAGDAGRIKQILVNLVANAIKFTERGFVRVTTNWESGSWQIAVQDSGIGIPAELQSTIFDEFRQADAGMTRQHGGSGLGLAIVKRFIHLMEGRIELQSVIGEGSTFRLYLPLAVPQE
jgi:PAS domain S-box-containing protein